MITKINNFNIPFEDLKLLNLEDDALINQEHKARDLDGDGDSDLFLGFGSFPQRGDFPQYPAILENNGDGTFSVVEIKNQTSKFIGPMIAEFADFNKDGRLDIFLGASGRDTDPFPGGQNTIFMSNSDGTYTDSPELLPQVKNFTHDATIGDVNGDGYPDIYASNVSTYPGQEGKETLPQLLLSQNGPTFESINLEGTIFDSSIIKTVDGVGKSGNFYNSSLLVDLNNDGILELVLGHSGGAKSISSKNIIVYQDGKGNFQDDTFQELPNALWEDAVNVDIKSTDINSDGLPDLVISQTNYDPYYDGRNLQFLIQQSDGTFKDETNDRLIGFKTYESGDTLNDQDWRDYQGSYVQFFDFVDIDQDGDLDISFNRNSGRKYPSNEKVDVAIFNYGNGVFVSSDDVGYALSDDWSPNAQPSDKGNFYGVYDFNGKYFFFSTIDYPIQWQNADIPLELTISEYEIAKPKYQLSNTTDSTKNILKAYATETQSGTQNYNSGDNIIIADGQAKTLRGLDGDDTYFISNLLPENSSITIIDTSGTNTIQIPSNTQVTKSQWAKDTVRLTFEDSRVITVNNADEFSYNLGGNVTNGTAGTDLTFSELALSFGVDDLSINSVGTIVDLYII
ncbi:VCBS repeat-containing protein [Hyphomicrobiales bacterium]|nr:VCBS repeat-containing protein [Hyphomicrobiales bacterium]